MIQPLRTIHRWVFMGFAVLLPAILVIAVTERHQYVAAGQLRVEPLSSTPVISQRGQFQLIAFNDGVELRATSTTPRPEVLVYWSFVGAKDLLPPEARLLGTYRGGLRYEVPKDSTGTVVLFSLTSNSVIDSVSIGRMR